MNSTIHLSGALEAGLKANAAAQGVSAATYLNQIVHKAFRVQPMSKPDKINSLRGILAEYGPALSEEEIDASRAEMLRGFAEKF